MLTELLHDYQQVRFDLDVTQELAQHAVFTHRESDLAFLTRLLATEGLSWRFDIASRRRDGLFIVVFRPSEIAELESQGSTCF